MNSKEFIIVAIFCVLGVNMTYSSNVLDLSESKKTSRTIQNADLADLIDQWEAIEGRLKNILDMHDDATRAANGAESRADELLGLLTQVENEQKLLLDEIARTPSHNMFDVIAKLNVWESVVMPKGSDPLLAQPSDLLVSSAMSDLKSGVVKPS